MKKKWKRLVWIAAALTLCLALTASALAEGPLSTLYGAAKRLLFETENVTLRAKVSFAYDGKDFKTFEGSYVQDGFNSFLNVRTHTPRADGSTFVGGYTVWGAGETAYSFDPVANPFTYSTSTQAKSKAVLSGTVMRSAFLRFGAAVAGAMEGAMSAHIAATALPDGGTQYHITLKEGDAPALINAAGTLFAQAAAKRLFDMNYEGIRDEAEQSYNVYWDDYEGLLDTLYQKTYGEKRPADFYAQAWQEDANEMRRRLSDLRQQTNDLRDRLMREYPSGATLVLPDGSIRRYENKADLLRERGMTYVAYEDFSLSFRRYYEEKTGAPLSRREMALLLTSGNAAFGRSSEALYSAFRQMSDEMTQKYEEMLKASDRAVVLYVRADGSVQAYDDVEAFERQTRYHGMTVKNQILYTMRALELGDTDVTVTLDGQNRFVSAAGTATLLVADRYGEKKPLTVSFESAAEDYDVSEAARFDPAAEGLIDWGAYWQQHGDEDARYYIPSLDEEYVPLPDSFTFDGVTYELIHGPVDGGSENG